MNAAVLAFEHEPTHLPSAVLAVSVHVLLFVVLIFGVSWQSRVPEAVSVELWDLAPGQKAELSPPEIKREPDPAPTPQVKPTPIVEPKPALKVEAKPTPIVETKPTPVPKKVDIAIEKKPAPKEMPIKLDMAKQMKDQLARELESVQRERERSELMSQFKPAATSAAPQIDATYGSRITAKIKPLINIPPDISGNPEAIYDVEQLPTGEILSVKLRKSSGHRAYDDAVERAILRASPLPRPDRAEQFQRRLELKFRPKE